MTVNLSGISQKKKNIEKRNKTKATIRDAVQTQQHFFLKWRTPTCEVGATYDIFFLVCEEET